jgi:hypothetical protein
MSRYYDQVTCDVSGKHSKRKEPDHIDRPSRHAQERWEQECASPVSMSFVSHRIR